MDSYSEICSNFNEFCYILYICYSLLSETLYWSPFLIEKELNFKQWNSRSITCVVFSFLLRYFDIYWMHVAGDDVPPSAFSMANNGEWDKFRNIDMDKEVVLFL